MIFRNRAYSVILSYNLILHPVECVKSYFGLLFFFNWKTLKNFFFPYAYWYMPRYGSLFLVAITSCIFHCITSPYIKKRDQKKMKPPMLKTRTTCKHPSVFYWMSYLHKLIFRINQNAVTLHIHIGSFSVVKCAS